jgi:hypothetical protein
MKNQINETKRMQVLAGLITENQDNEIENNEELDESAIPGELGQFIDYLSTLEPSQLTAAISAMVGGVAGLGTVIKKAFDNTDTMSGLNR